MEEVLINIIQYMDKKIIFADNYHTIRYLNQKAIEHYASKGYNKLIGESVLSFHKPETKQKLKDAVLTLEKNKDMMQYQINNTIVYAVRNKKGELIGYYEMY